MTLSAEQLYEKYRTTVANIIIEANAKKQASIPSIIAIITTDIVPAMMMDVGKIKTFSGYEKRDLIIKSVELILNRVFESGALQKAKWDETVKDILLKLLPPLIRLLIDVEKNDIKFNKKIKRCFSCCS